MDASKPYQTLNVKRRNVLRWLSASGVVAAVTPIFYVVGRYLGFIQKGGSDTTADISASDISVEHPSKLISINDEPILVILQPEVGIRAFTAKCTHLGCTVSYRPQMPGFYCKCHKGAYDINGINIPGTKPKHPLTELTVTQVGDELEISLIPKQKT